MLFIAFGLVSLLACWKWGDWRNWRQYYPTILYFMMGSLVYDFLAYNKPLWLYDGIFGKYPFLNIAAMVVTYPITVILFLMNFPVRFHRAVLRIVLWTALYAAVELLSMELLDFRHLNGWSMFYTLVFDLLMFTLLRLHHTRPLLALFISEVLAVLMLWWFRIPLTR